jgi:hypothetical protein
MAIPDLPPEKPLLYRAGRTVRRCWPWGYSVEGDSKTDEKARRLNYFRPPWWLWLGVLFFAWRGFKRETMWSRGGHIGSAILSAVAVGLVGAIMIGLAWVFYVAWRRYILRDEADYPE